MRVALILLALSAVCVPLALARARGSLPGQVELERMASRFAPTPLRVDVSRLSSGDRQALVKLVEAARIFDDVFLEQLWSGNIALYQRLQKDTSALGRARLHYFWMNKGPWSELDEYQAFLPEVPTRKPLGANFYPQGISKRELETWFSILPDKEQQRAKGFFTVIRPSAVDDVTRKEALAAVAYSEEYKEYLGRVAGLVREAAQLTDNASLRKFLSSRADAFLANDYYESDLAWMDLDAPLDITIGPYETYNDELFGYKAAFEAYVNLRDEAESVKLSALARHLQEIEDHLPLDEEYRNPKLGPVAPLRVVDEILSAGDGAHGVQTAAYNLPNDERVLAEKGSKRVMIKNVQEAKFHSILVPIAMKMLPRSQAVDVNFQSFFTHIVAHELMHGLGPHQIKVDGRDTTAREELKELYSPIEEAKADVTGLFALAYLMDHSKDLGLEGVLPSDDAAHRQLYVTYLASAFRSLRFGLHDAHGKGMAIQFNYLIDRGAFIPHKDGTFSIEMNKIRAAVRDLDHDLLMLEAEGNYPSAKRMLDELGVVRPAIKRALAPLASIPTDIEPIFITADEIAPPAARAPILKAAAAKSRNRRR